MVMEEKQYTYKHTYTHTFQKTISRNQVDCGYMPGLKLSDHISVKEEDIEI